MKKLFRRSLFCALAMLVGGVSAHAAVTRLSGPTTVYSESRRFVFFDAAYNSASHLYMAVWGTQAFGPVNGMLFDDNGQPLSAQPFALSDGAIWSGWARVIYSPQTNQFLVSYVKIVGNQHHQKGARFVTISNGTPVLGPEMILDDWAGDSGTASGMAYSTASGKFLVTYSHYAATPYGTFPVTFVATITSSGVPSCGPAIGPCTIISALNDGEANPEIACDPVNRKCLVVGEAWGILDGSGVSSFWYRFIDDATGTPVGTPAYYYNPGFRILQDPPSVVYMPATAATPARFMIATGLGGRILGSFGDASTLAIGAPFTMIQDVTGTQGSGYGFPALRYNPASGTAIAALTTWTGAGAAQELDGAANRVTGGFDLIVEPHLDPNNANSGNTFTVVAVNTNTAGLMALDNVFYQYVRIAMFSGAAGPPPPPPPPPCTATPAATAAAMPFQGGYGTINVSADTASCAWTVTSGTAWITIPVGTGSGPGAATFYAAVNSTGGTRTGTISIAGKTVTITQPGVNLSAVSDMSGDGFSDLMIRNTASGDIQALGVSKGMAVPLPSLQLPDGTPVWNVPVGYTLVGTGDLNGDGYADIVWQHQPTGNLYAWMMHGITIIATPALSIPSVGNMGWQVRGVGDVNGDGRADLIFQNTGDGSLAVWLMNGETVTSTMWITDGSGNRLTVGDTNWVIAGAGDLNHDGKADLVWQNRVTGALGGWTMNGNVVQAMQNLSPAWVPPDYKIGGVGDVNGDGLADLIWIRQSTGEVFVWCMSGVNAWWTGALLNSNGAPAVLGPNWTLVGPG